MKSNLLLLSFFFTIIFSAEAQKTTIKIGANYNADVTSHNRKFGKINYPSFELSGERLISKRFSIAGTFNYAQRKSSVWAPLSLNGGIQYEQARVDYISNDHTFII